jgi:LPXTG-site transpeptidase (sortase) family protein
MRSYSRWWASSAIIRSLLAAFLLAAACSGSIPHRALAGEAAAPLFLGDLLNSQYISAGGNHTCGVKDNGSIFCWGANAHGQTSVPASTFFVNNDFIQVSSGASHTCGVRDDYSITCWGNNDQGQIDVPSPNAGYRQVSAGSYHTCARKVDGSITCWGDDTAGQSSVPGPNTGFTSVSAGGHHTCGRKSDGTFVCWGDDTDGQLGTAITNSDFRQIAAGGTHTCGLKTDRSLECWGSNASGQITLPSPNTQFMGLSAGGSHTCGLKGDGSIVCWGSDGSGESTVPTPNSAFAQVSAGNGHTCGIKTDGQVVCWGSNTFYESDPFADDFDRLSTGDGFTCGLRYAESVFCWGNNALGQANAPTLNRPIEISAGGFHACARDHDGSVDCWGWNYYDQLTVPAPNSGFTSLTAGQIHTCGLKESGSVVCWGDMFVYSDVPDPNTNYISVAAGNTHTCGVRQTGPNREIICWGVDEYNQLDVPPFPNSMTGTIGAGDHHTCGKDNISGNLVCWGDNSAGQLNAPPPTSQYMEVHGGIAHTCAWDLSYRITCWGDNTYNQTDVPTPNYYSFMDAGGNHTCGIRVINWWPIVIEPRCWGADSFGQSSLALTHFKVPPYNQLPTASDDSYSAVEDTQLAIPASGVLANDNDPENDPLTAIQVSPPLSGTLALASDGSFTYDPDPDSCGPDSFTYLARTALGDSNTATVSLNVACVNDPPAATNLSAGEIYNEDTPLDLIDILITDVDSPAVTATLTLSTTAAGTLNTATSGGVTSTFAGGVWTASGALADVNTLLSGLTFTPAADYTSSFSIATSVSDGVASPLTGSKAMTPNPVNDPPAATNLSAAETYTEDTPLDLIDILITDVDSPAVTAALTLSNPAAGTLNTATSGGVTSTFGGGVWTASGALADVNILLAGLTYSPAPDYADSFGIATSISDGIATPLTGGKLMTPIPVNDPPSFTAGGDVTVAMNWGAYSAPWASGISAGPSDESSQTLTFHTSFDNLPLFTVPPTIAPDGTLSFSLANGVIGSSQVSVYLQDSGGTAGGGFDSSSTATFTITAAAFPVVTDIRVAAGGIPILPGGTVLAEIHHLTITFDRDIDNPPGSAGVDDVSNPANYLVLQPGPNGVFDTVDCAAGLSGDDLDFPNGSVVYDGMSFTSTVEMNSGQILPNGTYRIFVCGTTSITAGGIELAGDGMNSGTDYILDFSVIVPKSLPDTGFPPDVHTSLPLQPTANDYNEFSGLWLEIPQLKKSLPIIGVPIPYDTWNVTWLAQKAGWLEGTAFPTLSGNSVLTGHSTNANGYPGPFADLGKLRFGDKIIVHAWGQHYIYEVRSVQWVLPDAIQTVLRHEEYPWLTLFTCLGYDPVQGNYRYRIVVRAVQVSISP